MAATDQFYRNQRALDVVFGVSCILMLVSLIVMFYQDQKKEWKDDQRLANDVEQAIAQRYALDAMPSSEKIEAAEQAVNEAQDRLNERAEEVQQLEKQLGAQQATVSRAEARYQAKKADYDSLMSLVAIETEHRNAATDESRKRAYTAAVERMTNQLREMKEGPDGLDDRLRKFQEAEHEYNTIKSKIDEIKKPVTDAVAELKRLYTEFDRLAKLAAQKRWGWGAAFRNLPVIDAFNPPVRIHQFTLEDLPIDYNFKYVTRYDRCMSCHMAIDRPTYTKETLAALKEAPSELQNKMDNAKVTIARRRDLIQDPKEKELLDIDLGDLRTVPLSDKHINEFCAHPRLDLFVDDNSPHPKEKFGCTICHGGQGSATSFNLASHTPDTDKTLQRWHDDYHWAPNHYWDFPMLPKRFIESSCVKCHHQITDLIRDGSKNEAPKLLRGYNLVKDNGCFGCHEISGIKTGRAVGPDLRLEPWPPLDDLSPAERVKATSDPLNPPGTMRKVGPSLRRLSEKTHTEWVRKWIHNPRGFRPDTKMPHFYGLSNNTNDVLPESQKGFPEAEIHAIAHYLMQASQEYLQGKDSYRLQLAARRKELEGKKTRTDAEAKEFDETKRKLESYPVPKPLDDKTITLDGGATVPLPPEEKDRDAQMARGRQLFTERGCLACHSHRGTETPIEKPTKIPAVTGDAQFGPKLGQMTAKLGAKPGDRASARRWLVQWILNPSFHHPRTFMPITHLTVDQASDVAAWILSQEATWKADDVPEPSIDTLKALARVWLEKSRSQFEIDDLLEGKNPDWLNHLRYDSDESLLKGELTADKLKMYAGKKAVANQGCYGCHEIPGMEAAKPIGTALNDWGKKDPERLAFEDIGAFVRTHFQVPNSNGNHGNDKPAYDPFYYDQLSHRTRIGFLHQKLHEPRSYDHDRIRKWDERLRMPQFRFGRVDRKPKESNEDYAKRSAEAEAEAREAVMTFILGLVAEPVPAKYVHNPAPDRLAEVKGRQVLDKYNCAGCHLVRAGVYEFKKNKDVIEYLDGVASQAASQLKSEFNLPPHNSFTGRPQNHRIVAHGVPLPRQEDDSGFYVRLTEALRFTNESNQIRDIVAGLGIGIGTERAGVAPSDVLYQGQPYGGVFANLMVPYLKGKDRQNYGDDDKALAALPPPLLRQGEKTQPDWLFRFLRNPHLIRPLTILRMPKFNMSDDEAMALVNYFSAADRLQNPSEGLVYPYVSLPQRDDAYWHRKSREYVERLKQVGLYEKRMAELKPLWEQLLKAEGAEWERKSAAAEAALKEAKDDTAKKSAQQALEDLKRQRAERSIESMQRAWEERDAYAADAYRLLANYNTPCLNCHQVGNVPGKQNQGPALEIGWERLRPQWTHKWLANPMRMLSYQTPMPANFDPTKVDPKGLAREYPEFVGTPMEQITAVRDLLMNFPRIAELPINRVHRPPLDGGSK